MLLIEMERDRAFRVGTSLCTHITKVTGFRASVGKKGKTEFSHTSAVAARNRRRQLPKCVVKSFISATSLSTLAYTSPRTVAPPLPVSTPATPSLMNVSPLSVWPSVGSGYPQTCPPEGFLQPHSAHRYNYTAPNYGFSTQTATLATMPRSSVGSSAASSSKALISTSHLFQGDVMNALLDARKHRRRSSRRPRNTAAPPSRHWAHGVDRLRSTLIHQRQCATLAHYARECQRDLSAVESSRHSTASCPTLLS